jgi:GT2 family glycosyltransferase
VNTHNPFEVIIVDDKSDTLFDPGNYPGPMKVIVNDEARGVTYSWNRGIEMAGVENTIVIVNNDIIFEKDWDVPLLKAIEEGASIASPYHVNTFNDAELFQNGLPTNVTTWHDNGGFQILGSCFMCRPNLFKDIGLFPEVLKLWFNDNWLVRTLEQRKESMVFCKDSHVLHLYSQTIGRTPNLVWITNKDAEEFNKLKF